MNNLTLVIMLVGVGLTWVMDASVRKKAKTPERWIATILLIMAVGFIFLKKFNVSVVLPADWLIQWITPWMKRYITGG